MKVVKGILLQRSNTGHMKHKIFLLSIVCSMGCIQSTATDLQTTLPGSGMNEITGSVIDEESKKPLKDVSVTAYLSSKKEKQVITDEFGKFDFHEMKPGIYKLVFEKEGYKKVTKEKVTIKSDESFQMRIELFEHDDFDLMPSHFHFINF